MSYVDLIVSLLTNTKKLRSFLAWKNNSTLQLLHMAIQALVRPPGYHTHCYGFSYEADNELGNLEVMDTIYLNVSDTAGNMAAMQRFVISIRATDNTAPVVTITTELEVNFTHLQTRTFKHSLAREWPNLILFVASSQE